MPILKNLNNLDKSINKRIVQAQLKQASEYLPDIPPSPVDGSVTSNFTQLMKSLSYISLIFKQVLTVARSYHQQLTDEVDAEMEGIGDSDSDSDEEDDELDDDSNDDELPNDPWFRGNSPKAKARRRSVSFGVTPDDLNEVSFRGLSSAQSPFSFASESTIPNNYADDDITYSLRGYNGRDLPTPQEIREHTRSSFGSTPLKYRHGRVTPARLNPNPGGDDSSSSSSSSSRISDLTNRTRTPITKKIIEVMNVNALEKEAINVKFLLQELSGQIGSLNKIQKSKLLKIATEISNQIFEIIEYYPPSTKIYDQLYNIFVSLRESLKIIESELKQAGEQTGGGMISGSTQSMYGAGLNKKTLRMHAPSKYVNQNFFYNLAKRNN